MNQAQWNALLSEIRPVSPEGYDRAQARLDRLTKPLGSLGRLEETARRLAAIQGTDRPVIRRKRVYTLAGDHGVTEEGVSAYPREVTPQMVLNFLAGGAAINVLTRHVGAEIRVVDVGVDYDFGGVSGLLHRKVGRGTRNFTRESAMTPEQTLEALAVGFELAREAKRDGVELIGVGEMGIGNTTPAAAILAAFSGLSAEQVVGRGTGVDDEGLRRKATVVERALRLHAPDPGKPFDVLQRLGGFEIAAMTGLYVGAAHEGLPVVADGFISTSAALVAIRLCPAVGDYLFLSHLSQEKAHQTMVGVLGRQPLLVLDMRLGEGTGAALAMGILEASAKILTEMATFEEAGVSDKEA